jgi:hypothetical protein
MNNRIMYQTIKRGTYGEDGFNADVLRFTDDLEDAKKYDGEIYKITYVEYTWKIWKIELIRQ